MKTSTCFICHFVSSISFSLSHPLVLTFSTFSSTSISCYLYLFFSPLSKDLSFSEDIVLHFHPHLQLLILEFHQFPFPVFPFRKFLIALSLLPITRWNFAFLFSSFMFRSLFLSQMVYFISCSAPIENACILMYYYSASLFSAFSYPFFF